MASEPLDEKAIFNIARKIDLPAARAAYLRQVCGADAVLLEQVETLLHAYEEQESFLESPPISGNSPTSDPSLSVRPGMQIGPYKLLQQIGEGGMGVVYMAEQLQPVHRRVALKIIKPGMDTRQVIARFEAERQALSLMDHPNIAKVLDAGTTDSGRPYFVMELVKGPPITQYCDEHHLTPRQRLELLLPVCQAIQHAHQKGIIHRDIKPTNILVAEYDHQPVPKVIDFGVAKATSQALTEKTMFTGFGQIVGTLEYMSPEQAKVNQLDIDTRSDIYSLGVLLYELLTGSTPFDKQRLRSAAFDEMLRIIREEEPEKPSTRLSSAETLPSIAANRSMEPARLGRTIRGELDWIVMKCLEKDRNRRYETASGFVADLQRYLNNEPVQACPPSAAYRFRKFAQRNMAAVVTVAVFLIVLVSGIAGTTFGLIRAEYRRAEAEQARFDEAAQRKIADAEKKKAEQAEADTLADYRASTDDAIEQLIGSKPVLGPQEKTYLEKMLKRWQAFAARQGNDERSQAIRAEGHHRVAILWMKLGQRDASRPEFETARNLYKKLAEAFPAVPDYQHELARTRINLGLLLAGLGQRDAARAELETARDLQTKLVAAFPAVPVYQQKLALAHTNLGDLLGELGQGDAARMEYQTAHDLCKKLADAFPAAPHYHQDLARSHNKLGQLLAEMGQSDKARTEYETARDLQKKVTDAFPAVPDYQQDLASTHLRLGKLLDGLGQRDLARTEFETAIDLQKKLATAFPAVPLYQVELATTHGNLGVTLVSLGLREAARTEFESARDLQQKLATAFPAVPAYQQTLATTHNNLGNVLKDPGQREAARTEYETARELQQKLVGAFPTVPAYQQELARTHNNLGVLLKDLGERDAARTEYETARDLYKKLAEAFPAVPEYQVDLGGSYFDLGNLIRNEGQPADSLHWYDLAIRTLTPVYEKDARAVRAKLLLRNSHSNRAVAYDDLKQYAEAVKDWDKAIEIDPQDGTAHYNVGLALYHQGKFEKSIAASQQAIKLDPTNASAYVNLALALVKLNDPKKLPEAVTAAEKAIEISPKSADTYYVLGVVLGHQKKVDAAAAAYQKAIDLDPQHAMAHYNLGSVLGRQKKFDQAAECFRKVVEINPKDSSAYIYLGISLRNLKKLDEAIQAYGKAIDLDPKSADAHHNLGNALLDQGKLPEAIVAYRKTVELDPKNAEAHYELAWRLTVCSDLKLREPKEALVSARLAVQLDPKNGMYWQGLGYAEYRSGNWKAAVEAFQKVKDLGSAGDSLEWFPLSMAYWQLGDKEAARMTYDQAVQWMEKHNPNDGFLRGLQAEAAELMGIELKKE